MLRNSIIHCLFVCFIILSSCSKEEQPRHIPEPVEGLRPWEGNVFIERTYDTHQFLHVNEITGFLVIRGRSQDDRLTMERLKELTTVHGNVYIEHSNLENLEGLENLSFIGGDLVIDSDGLIDVDLPALKMVKGNIIFRDNSKMAYFDGFNALEAVSSVIFEKNPELVEVAGFDALPSTSSITIEGNKALKQLGGFGYLTEIPNIKIELNPELERITGFLGIKRISSDLNLSNNPKLEDISGFSKIETIDGYLNLFNNYIDFNNSFPALISIKENLNIFENYHEGEFNSFNNLVHVGGNIGLTYIASPVVKGFDKITSLNRFSFNSSEADIFEGLKNLETVTDFQIGRNTGLKEIGSFEKLHTVKGDFSIDYNEELLTIDSFKSLKTIDGNFLIENNSSLEEIYFSDNLQELNGENIVRYNYDLKSIKGFNGLDQVGLISIYENLGLMNFEAFNHVLKVHQLNISGSPKLKSLQGFKNLQLVESMIWLSGNSELSDITALQNLEEVGIDLNFGGNALRDLSGLSGLRSVGNVLKISNEDQLVNLNGLQNLTSEIGAIDLSANGSLVDITAISKLAGIKEYLSIWYNYNLSSCAIELVCRLVQEEGMVNVYGNAEGCETLEVIKEHCSK